MRLARTLAYNGCRLVHLDRPLLITKAQAQYIMTALRRLKPCRHCQANTQTNVMEQGDKNIRSGGHMFIVNQTYTASRSPPTVVCG